MITYVLEGGKKYLLSYKELKEKYACMCALSDTEFLNALPSALHLACIICYLKEKPTYIVLADDGIIHELAHLIDGSEANLQEVRELFKEQLELA